MKKFSFYLSATLILPTLLGSGLIHSSKKVGKELQKTRDRMTSEMRGLKRNIMKKKNELAEAQKEIAELSTKIKQIPKEIAGTEKKVQELRESAENLDDQIAAFIEPIIEEMPDAKNIEELNTTYYKMRTLGRHVKDLGIGGEGEEEYMVHIMRLAKEYENKIMTAVQQGDEGSASELLQEYEAFPKKVEGKPLFVSSAPGGSFELTESPSEESERAAAMVKEFKERLKSVPRAKRELERE